MQRRKTLLNALRPFAESLGRDCRRGAVGCRHRPAAPAGNADDAQLLTLAEVFPSIRTPLAATPKA